MLYLMEKSGIHRIDDKTALESDKKYVGVSTYEEADGQGDKFGLRAGLLSRTLANDAIRFESYDHLDMLCIAVVDLAVMKLDVPTMHLFIWENIFFIVCEDQKFVHRILEKISAYDKLEVSYGRLLFHLFDKLLEDDNSYLDKFEEKIMALEKKIIDDKRNKNYVNNIIGYRKKLVLLKRYYEQVSVVFKYIDLNENKLFDHQSLKLLRILAGKVDRLYNNVLSLIEYVAQIREAYQAEVDINLNTTMKIFTVITTIFFPLSLIAGWYGMNFNMPEYQSLYGYPMVIILSAGVIIASVVYFKRNHWF
ncbi:CorA family divalent cation transporter [Eubacterium sp. 1001713B170207_170306_E7]|uniref:magnesium transporter CorA family protein n=1 Tax=Eubacterium sp. 1001713B170207_170306_E7 TaxID=2787097 RepID=UPI001896B744|nr:CorA family divalent cation transporter [Eubacterium sp. 1001713B170207_170306_E7]